MDKVSPFQPGKPVSPDRFVGRSQQISRLNQVLRQAKAGNQQHVFLLGERGIGKTSLISFILKYAEKQEFNLMGFHALLGGCKSTEDVVKTVFTEILKKTASESWFSKIKGLFSTHIQEVGLFGINLAFNPPKDKLQGLERDFSSAIHSVIKGIGDAKSGLIIVLDDINGLSKDPAFANWYKSLADRIAVEYKEFPVLFIVSGTPDVRNELSANQPSLMRIFEVMEVDFLADTDVTGFYSDAFRSSGMEVEAAAIEVLVKATRGIPTFMQEIGDATFWVDEDESISKADALDGVYRASENIGRKYLDSSFYDVVRSEKYRAIITKLGIMLGQKKSVSFTRKELLSEVSEHEQKVVGNFLKKLSELRIIQPRPDSPRGTYEIANPLYRNYIIIKSVDQLFKRKSKSS